VIVRVGKNGAQPMDLSQTDGLVGMALANGNLYWAVGSSIMSCSLSSGCVSGQMTLGTSGQSNPHDLFSNESRTRLFWIADQSTNDSSRLMTLSSSSPLATDANGFYRGAANDSFAWTANGLRKLLRIALSGGAKVEIGDALNTPVHINSSEVFFLKEFGSPTPSLNVFKFSQSAGPGSLAQSVGGYPFGGLGGDLWVDDQNAYSLFYGAERGSTPEGYKIYKCSVAGCGSNPTTVDLPNENDVNGLIGDDQAVYWSTTSGIYKLAK
jgi:hypothetical protein